MTITLKKYSGTNNHLKIMVGWLRDPDVVRYSEQRHRQHDEESQAQYIADGPDVFREIHSGEDFIGTISAYVDAPNSVADVGILIGEKDQWGNGYGFEAWRMFCDDLFANGIRKIEAGTMSLNKGMIRIFENYDMVREGSRYSHFWLPDRKMACDMLMWGKFA